MQPGFRLGDCEIWSQAREGNLDADTKAIKGIWIEYASSLNAGDVSRWVYLWTEDGVQMPPGEPPVIGKDRIRKRIQGILDEVRFNMRIEPREVKVAGD